MAMFWPRLVKEGEDLLNYLVNNFHDMIDGEIIKHFNFRYVSHNIIDYVDNIKEKYLDIIQSDLVYWIQNEFNENRLLNKNNWRPFRDRREFDTMYLGYNKLFQYEQYYFQLAIESDIWDDIDDCKYCKNGDSLIHFELALYGWIDNRFEYIQPDNKYIVLSDNMMPISDWNKNNFK